MTERIFERRYSSKVYDLGNGQRRLRAHAGHIHFRDDATGALADIDHTWVDRGTFWEMTRASYRMQVAKDFSAPALIRYRNRFEGADHAITYEPHSLVWATGRDLSDVRPFRAQQAVTGVVNGPTIRWADAFGPGLHFEVSLRGSGFTKEIVIQRRNALEQPPTAQHRLVLLSRYDGPGLDLKDTQGRTWAKAGEFDDAQDDGFRIEEPSGKHSLIRPAYIIESDAEETRHRCPVVWTSRNGALWQAKVLPTAVLVNGTYPLRADTVTSYYAGAGDGYIDASDAVWSTARTTTSGTPDSTATTTRVNTAIFASYSVRRSFFPIDTSGLGAGANVTAATWYGYVTTRTYNNPDAYDYLVLVGPTTQADPTTLVAADHIECGSVNSPTEVSARDTINNVPAVGNYYSQAITDLGVVSTTGYTLLGMREGHDVEDQTPLAENQIRFSTSEQSGTSQDPYLEVTYTVAGPTLAWVTA